MCYSNCKNENYHGECTKRIDKYDMSLHCFEGFKCSYCGEIHLDTDNAWQDDICIDCATELDLVHCVHCGYNSEKSERENGSHICPDCGEKI